MCSVTILGFANLMEGEQKGLHGNIVVRWERNVAASEERLASELGEPARASCSEFRCVRMRRL